MWRLTGQEKGGEKTVEKIVRSKNALSSPVEYEIPAEEIWEIFKLAETLGLEVLGFYHSHPFHEPSWSVADEQRSKLWLVKIDSSIIGIRVIAQKSDTAGEQGSD